MREERSNANHWRAIVILDGGTAGGIEIGSRLEVTTKTTCDEALAAAKAAMLATVGAVGFTACRSRQAA